MANKTHCDICDETPATNEAQKVVAIPGKPNWDKGRLLVKVEVWGTRYASHKSEPEPFGQKDVCEACRAKLVAEAFGLRTAQELYDVRDELNARIQALEAPTPPLSDDVQAELDKLSAPSDTASALLDPDIPF